MSKHHEQFRVSASLADAVQACERALPPLQRSGPWQQGPAVPG